MRRAVRQALWPRNARLRRLSPARRTAGAADGAGHVPAGLRPVPSALFDERIGEPAPRATPDVVRGFVQRALVGYILQNPTEISKADSAVRRVPLNFPRPPDPPARNAQGWVARRAAVDERILWNKTCAECHDNDSNGPAAPGALPVYAASNVTKQWMPRAVRSYAAPDGEVPGLPRRREHHEDGRRAVTGSGRVRLVPRPGAVRVGRRREPLLRVPSISRLDEESARSAFLFFDGLQVRTR